jgi:alanyl-tRNA synthetase
VITEFFPERDSVFIKLLAQKLTAGKSTVIALLASGSGQSTLVFAQTPGQKSNMGHLMKDAMAQLGGRGGGSADMAQGGLAVGVGNMEDVERALQLIAATLPTSQPHS